MIARQVLYEGAPGNRRFQEVIPLSLTRAAAVSLSSTESTEQTHSPDRTSNHQSELSFGVLESGLLETYENIYSL